MGDRLNEKVALVSGAGSRGPGWGNGKATAVLFAREAHRSGAAAEICAHHRGPQLVVIRSP